MNRRHVERTIEYRRHHKARIRAKAKRIVQRWHGPDVNNNFVARMAEVHCRPCSCVGCSYQKKLAIPKISLVRSDISFREYLEVA